MDTIQIERLLEATPEAAEELGRLLRQLTNRPVAPLTVERLQRTLDSGTITLVARDGGRIVGVIMLVVARQLVGARCWIEDLVVDEAYRGKGVATGLMEAVLAAVPEDADTINLSSKPSRAEARAWYERFGFVLHGNVYRLKH